MSEERPGGEPTEPPSEKKLREARLRGEVPLSREVTSAVIFLAVALALYGLGPRLLGGLRGLLSVRLAQAPALRPALAQALELTSCMSFLLPVLLSALVAAVLGNLIQTGPLFSLRRIKPDLQRFHPSKNLRNPLGKESIFELGKGLIKLAGLGTVSVWVLSERLPLLLATLGRSPEILLDTVLECLAALALRVGILMAFLGAIDWLHQRRAFLKRMRMTRVEVQREQKESEGDPRRKAERRRVHHEILSHQMLEQVASADCLIINPDHVAVAVRYDEKTMSAPRVVASGHRLMAARMREIARQKGIPIVRNVPLARALAELELDQEIPSELYEALAEVLRFVYGLSRQSDRTE